MINMLHFAKKIKGFILIEAIIGVAILAFSLLGIISAGQGFLRLSFLSFQGSQANFLLEESAEVSRAFRDLSWNNIGNLTVGTKYYLVYAGGKWSTSTAVSTVDTVFYRYITVANVNRNTASVDANTKDDILSSGGTLDSGTRKVTATVEWKTSTGTSSKSAVVYLTSI